MTLMAQAIQIAKAMAAGGGGSPGFRFATLVTGITTLEQTVHDGIAADKATAHTFWNDVRRVIEYGPRLLAERQRFYAECERIEKGALGHLNIISSSFHSGIKPNGEAHVELAGDRDHWRGLAQEVRAMRREARRLESVEGWSGTAAEGYSASARVQIAAMQELAQVMDATADGCHEGSLMNEMILTLLSEEVTLAIEAIQNTPTRQGDNYFTRTAASWNECAAIVSTLLDIARGSTASGASSALTSDLMAALSSPNLLGHGWPTGTSADGVLPAERTPVGGSEEDLSESGSGGPGETGARF